MSDQQLPRQEWIDWFVDSPVEESQELADMHGDATKDRR